MASDNQVSSILLLILIGLAIYFLLNPYEGFNNKSQTEFFDGSVITNNNGEITGSDNEINYENLSEDEIQKLIDEAQLGINNYSSVPDVTNSSSLPVVTNSSSVPVPMLPPITTSIQSNIFDSSMITPINTQEIIQSEVPKSNLDNKMQSSQPPVQISSVPVVSQNVYEEIIKESASVQPQQTLFEPKTIKPSVTTQPPSVTTQPPSSIQPQMSYNPNIIFDKNDIASIATYDPSDEDYDYTGTDLTSAFLPPLPPGTKPDAIDFKKNNVDKYNSKDFLPKQVNDEWFETDFSLAKYQLNDDKLINTEKYIIGINTVGESLKNASYDIRGTIPNPKFIVSPWNNSTYEPDFNLKPLC